MLFLLASVEAVSLYPFLSSSGILCTVLYVYSQIQAIVRSRQSRQKFDRTLLGDLGETEVLETKAFQVTPLVTNPGTLLLTTSTLYFQPHNNVEKVCLSMTIFIAVMSIGVGYSLMHTLLLKNLVELSNTGILKRSIQLSHCIYCTVLYLGKVDAETQCSFLLYFLTSIL